MSTRRARIKAVTSLPQRRKNAPKVDNKAPEEPLNDCEEKAKSPKLSHINKTEEIRSSPIPKVQTPVRARRTSVISSVEKVSESVKVVTPILEKRNTPKQSERVPVITSASSLRSLLFSPPSKRSPLRKHVPSPVLNAKITENIEKTSMFTKESVAPKTVELVKEKDTQSVKGKTVEENVIEKTKVAEKSSSIPDDYQVPSVPESIIDDPMDGIVPLQPVATHKPIAVLKNEIISEHAEVLFDPIVPLPSPSKVRPKLRPVPRLAPLRRNSVQGSASESEDESRRALLNMGGTPSAARQRHDSQTSVTNREMSRIRNDSICSNASHATASQATATSPVKERTRSRRQEISRKMAAVRRRRETLKRDGLTMYDLIFYNPLSNPFIPNKDETEAKETNDKEAAKQIETEEESADEQQDAAPVPQIKLGPDGKIILDEQSLVIKQSQKRMSRGVVREGAWSSGARPYRRTQRTADWHDAETVRFYRALAAIGTDFTLMEPLFPGRTRRDLKLKFKKEEKLNCAQVDKAIRSAVEWDAGRLIDEFAKERADEARRDQLKRELLLKEKKEMQQRKRAAKEIGVKQSLSAKMMGNCIMPAVINQDPSVATTADEIIERATETKKQRKRKRKEPAPLKPTKKAADKIPMPKTPQIITPQRTTPQLTTCTVIKSGVTPQSPKRLDPVPQPKTVNVTNAQNPIPVVPANVEEGSLVVLTVNDPNSPSKKMLQTYIASGAGKLTPVDLPSTFLNSVVGYMQRSTPKSNSARSSPLLSPPSNASSHDSKAPSTPGVIQINPSPSKQKLSSYSITPL